MKEYIRRFSYIQDYYWTQNQWAADLYVASYPVTYYMIDWENSIYDENLAAASYEKYGLGELSGMIWFKIQMVPVFQIEQIQPNYNADERGLILKDSDISSIVMPSKYVIQPREWDFIHFHQDFMFHNDEKGPLFVVKGTEMSTHGEINYRKLNLKVTDRSSFEKIESQISTHYMFLEFTKEVHPINTARQLLNIQNKNGLLSKQLEGLYHKCGLYLNELSE